MHAGFHGPDRHAKQVGDLVQRQVAQEEERQRFALRQRELVHRVVNLLGVVERGGVVGRVGRLVQVRAVRRDLVRPRQAKAADRGVAGRRVEERRQRAGVADRVDGAEHLQPRFLEQVPCVLLGRREPPQVLEERPLPHRHDPLERRAIAPLAAEDEEFAVEDLFLWNQGSFANSGIVTRAPRPCEYHQNGEAPRVTPLGPSAPIRTRPTRPRFNGQAILPARAKSGRL